MKKIRCISLLTVLILLFPQPIQANMAAPSNSDVASTITFEKNESISVLSEVLDITVEGSKALIVASYHLKNTSEEPITTRSMFLSPNIENSDVKVLVNKAEIPYTSLSYVLNYATEITTNDWQYAVLTDKQIAQYNEGQSVDSLTFDLEFNPHEEVEIIVSYMYRLGGYPDYNFNAKMGRIEYYLAPASMWKEFGGITINLNLDKDMPVISRSNLEFKKVGNRQYQYISDTLPTNNLEIVIDENWWQNILSTLRSPYLSLMLMTFLPIILIILITILLIVWFVRKKKK